MTNSAFVYEPKCWGGGGGGGCGVSANDDLFDRLETVSFFRLFTGEGDMENMGCGNTEPRGLKARVLPLLPSCPDSLWRGACEHVLHCDGSLEGLIITRVWAKMLSCKLLSNTAAFVLYILWCWSPMPSHVRTLCRTSVLWRADRCHCQAAEFMLHICFKISSKLYILSVWQVTSMGRRRRSKL